MSLLENILANSRKINFNLTKSLNENIYAVRDENPVLDLPVVTKKSTWETINTNKETYMTKSYKFNLSKHLIYFVSTILERANNVHHHPVVLIDENIVEIKLYTKDINDITELDIEFSKFVEEIYAEINYILEF